MADINLTGEFDARVWTEEWLRIIKEKPSIPTDKGTMLGWFSNAIMAGYDHAKRELSKSNVHDCDTRDGVT